MSFAEAAGSPNQSCVLSAVGAGSGEHLEGRPEGSLQGGSIRQLLPALAREHVHSRVDTGRTAGGAPRT